MDTITHGIAGALIGKAFFDPPRDAAAGLPRHAGSAPGGQPQSGAGAGGPAWRHKAAAADPRAQAGRIAIGAVTLGSVFPDSDVVFNLFVTDGLATLELHRGFTHSLLCLPLFAMLLAWGTRGVARWRGWSAPSWGMLTAAWGAGIASHILLDLVTSFGTMIWSPLSNHRAAWDMNFILDFAMTGIVLAPQLAAWAHRRPAGRVARALAVWTLLSLGALGVEWLARTAGFPFSPWAVVAASGIAAALAFGPLARRFPGAWRGPAARAKWARAGTAALAAYLLACAGAQTAARRQVEGFAREHGLRVENLAALPLPPSLFSWGGLVRTPEGVYQSRFDLWTGASSGYQFVADSPANRWTEAARARRSTEIYLWFARFPVIRYREENGRHVVESTDLRFFTRGAERRNPFTFRVAFDAEGRVVEEGWVD